MPGRLGAHMSIAGGVSKAFDRGEQVGCEAMQIFTKNQNQWRAKPLEPEEVERFYRRQRETGIGPVVAHDAYLINLASPDDALWEKSLKAFIDELERAEALGLLGVVMHPGSHTGAGEEVGLDRIARALDRAHAATQGFRVLTILEITAGQGTNLGYTFEQLAAIRQAVDDPARVGVCFDTAHALAAGYEFRTPDTYAAMWEHFDEVLGLDLIKCFHLNDSKRDLGSRVDRHTHIGQGYVGLEAFRLLINDPRFDGLPMLLETPKGPDMKEDIENLRVLRSLIES
ncbi:MAG TPA: deoxyribonuclease IV [Caldilineae bacterium]|nr:deoxyribonuclease IV [Caldilineae bacterium]